MKSLTFRCLVCALNLYFAQKLPRKAKLARGCWNRKKLLQRPNVAPKLPSTIGTGLSLGTNVNTPFHQVFTPKFRPSAHALLGH